MMSAIDVGKRLFRLWVVLTFCWMTLIGSLIFDDLLAMRVKESGETGEICKKQPINLLAENPEPPSIHCEYHGKELTLQDPQRVGATADQALVIFHDQHPELFRFLMPDWDQRFRAMTFILLPPALFLLLGLVGIWFLRGFGSSPPLGR